MRPYKSAVHQRCALVVFILLAGSFIADICAAQSFSNIVKIVDTSTPIPGGSGSFTTFIDPFNIGPSICGTAIGFNGFGSGQQAGVYVADVTDLNAGISTVLDTTSVIPGAPGSPRSFASMAVGCPPNHGTYFVGVLRLPLFDSPQPHQAIVKVRSNGQIETVVDYNTPVPGGVGNYTGFSLIYCFDGENVAFCGADATGQLGEYNDVGGQINIIANAATPIPNGVGNFTTFGRFNQIDAGNTAFGGYGDGGQAGVYTHIAGQLARVADTNTPIPGGTGTFVDFGSMAFQAGVVAFIGYGSGGQVGVYTNFSGTLQVVADIHTFIPYGTGTFTNFPSFFGPALDDGRIAVSGRGNFEQRGIYLKDLSAGTPLRRVVDNSQVLDGRSSPYAPYMSPKGLSGGRLVFHMYYPDSSEAIFMATGLITGTGDTQETPRASSVEQNRPNPFNPATIIPYHTASTGRVEIRIFDARGRLIRNIQDGVQSPGDHSVAWDGTDRHGVPAPSGLYFYRLTTGGFHGSRRMLLLR